MTTWLIFIALSLLPIIGWLYFFQSQHREKLKFVVLTFIAGMTCIIPIKLYEKYWHQSLWDLEHLNIFAHLNAIAEGGLNPGVEFFSYLVVTIGVAFFIFLFAALALFLLEVLLSHDNTVNTFRKKARKILETPFFFLSIGLVIGLAAYFLSGRVPERVWFFVMVGMIEEFTKHMIVRFTDDEKINSVADAISFSVIVALGFAFIENILYLQNFWSLHGGDLGQFSVFYVLRSLFPVIAHVCFSAVVGYFYGRAKFSAEIYSEEQQRFEHPVINWIHRVFGVRAATLFHEEQMFLGLCVAMILHAIFNGLLEYGRIEILTPFLLLCFWWVLRILHARSALVIHHEFPFLKTSF